MKIIPFEDMIQVDMTNEMFGLSLHVSIFYIDGLLIDTGTVKKKRELLPYFHEWDIQEVIVTHHHEDHTGLAYWLQQQKDVPIYTHALGLEKCQQYEHLPLYRRVFWGSRKPFQPRPLKSKHQTKHYTWDIIYTPGHANDHIALFNREKKWLFGGDLYVQPRPKSMFAFESVPDLINSLKKILTYDFKTYICSHAGIIHQGREAIKRKLNYLENMQQDVLSLYEEGMSPRQIRKKLLPEKHPLHYLSFFENSPKHMVNSILK